MKKQQKVQKSGASSRWLKVGTLLVLLICVVGFTLNMGFFSYFTTAQPGSVATVDYTIRDDEGRAILTSVSQIALESYQNQEGAFFTDPLQLEVGGTQDAFINPVDVYVTDGQSVYSAGKFALFSSEIDGISSALEGMRVNDRKTVSLDAGDKWERTMTAEEFENIGGNFTGAQVGDYVPMGFVDAPVIAVDNTTPEIATRWVKVTDKGDGVLAVQYGYATADIVLKEISG
jgi:FKBP-type peptidyl-prolyl cis-trans isomerase 2